MPEVLALIPAWGAVEGPAPNDLRLLLGFPLVAWAAAAAKQSALVDRTVCLTDSPEVAEAARRHGAEVPFPPSAEPGRGAPHDLALVQRALGWFEARENWRPGVVVLLRPSTPLRFPGQVDRAVRLLSEHPDATAVRTVCRSTCGSHEIWRRHGSEGTPFLERLLDSPGDGRGEPPRRVWWQTGCVDAVRSEIVRAGSLTGPRVLPLPVDARHALDVDGDLGVKVAEAVMEGLDCVRPGPAPDWGRVRLLVLDVDGTLTPGTMYYGPDGEALKRFHTHDGHGIHLVRKLGVEVAIITGEDTAFTTSRARKLGIGEVQLGVKDKLPALDELCRRLGASLDEVAYVGDDVGDLAPMNAVREAGGVPCAVADARPEIRAAARFICRNKGGYGAVRDVCDLIAAGRNSR